MSREGRDLARRSWQRHPVLSALYVAVALGLAIVGLLNVVNGHSQFRGGVYVVLFVAWFVLVVVLVRRDEPPSDR
jgi:high-affinity Fe2+/Pb2+ permease